MGVTGFDAMFQKDGPGGRVKTRAKDAKWLLEENLGQYSPKGASILRLVRNSKGVDFI